MNIRCKLGLHKYKLNGDDVTPFGLYEYYECQRKDCKKMISLMPVKVPFWVICAGIMLAASLVVLLFERLILIFF